MLYLDCLTADELPQPTWPEEGEEAEIWTNRNGNRVALRPWRHLWMAVAEDGRGMLGKDREKLRESADLYA